MIQVRDHPRDTLFALPVAECRMLDFELAPELEASEPPEARGLERDEVRLLVSYHTDDRVAHARFRDISDFLSPGDVLVINTSGTLNAALGVSRADGTPLELHLSTRLPADLWIVELRQPDEHATKPFYHGTAGERLRLPGNATATLLVPYRQDQRVSSHGDGAASDCGSPLCSYRPPCMNTSRFTDFQLGTVMFEKAGRYPITRQCMPRRWAALRCRRPAGHLRLRC